MFYTIASAVVVMLAALLAFAAARPGTFRVERAIIIQAPPEKMFPLIDDFHQWALWSPYEKLDRTMKKTFSGAPSGKGAVYQWSGNSKVGEGRMEITETCAPSKVLIKLDFVKPFTGHQTAGFTLEPGGNSTKVTWATYGPTSYMAKVMTIFVSMDNLVGKEFAAGLVNLKAIAER